MRTRWFWMGVLGVLGGIGGAGCTSRPTERYAREAGALTLPSGAVMRTLKFGGGPSPTPSDVVTVHYEGRLPDGTRFDSTRLRGRPMQFHMRSVIPCWTEAIQRMKLGEVAQIVCPPEVAYGAAGKPPHIPGNATLLFEVELLGIGDKTVAVP